MFERLKKLYENGQITAEMLNTAIAKGWITAEQAKEIMESEVTA